MNQTIINTVTIVALATVAIILFMGLFNMFRGGNPNLSQTLMRARVIAQAVALVLILGALALFGTSHA
jgi:hypothetical protein